VSYLRLRPNTWSAPYQVWGVENREAALRLIPTALDHCAAHLEIKAVDPTTNPYLLLGALQALVIDAVSHPSPLPEPVVGDPAALPVSPPRLPETLADARTALADDNVLQTAMGDLLHGSLLDSFAGEIQRVDGLLPEEQVASACWWPLVGGIVADQRRVR
jgi:glutamine synthetase